MTNGKKKKLLTGAGILVCLLAAAGIYGSCLQEIPEGILQELPGDISAAEMDGRGCGFFGRRLILGTAESFQLLAAAIWPAPVWALAGWMRKKARSVGSGLRLLGQIFYYFICVTAILLLEEGMVRSVFRRREPFETFYLFLAAAAAWNMPSTQFKKGRRYRRTKPSWRERIGEPYVYPVLLAALALICLFWKQQRLVDILCSLSNPVSCIQGPIGLVNWLGHRFVMTNACWQGDFSVIEEPLRLRVFAENPLVRLNAVKGFGAVVAVLALEGAALYLMWLMLQRAKRSHRNGFAKLLLFSLVAKSALGLLAELLAVTSTNIGLLLLRNPADMILICLFLAVVDQEKTDQSFCL